MRSLQFTVTGSTGLVIPESNQRVIFYGCEFIVGGATPPTSVAFNDTLPTLLSPDMNGLLPGVLHELPIVYTKDGFPVPRGVGGVGLTVGCLVTGGASPTVRGTFFFDFGT